MSAPELRPYQRDVIAEFDRTRESKRRIILVAPTGAGKTVIGADIIRSFVRTAKSVLVLAHRREIIAQTSGKLHDQDITHGIIQAGFQPRPLELVQVAHQFRRCIGARDTSRGRWIFRRSTCLVVDEAHHCPAGTYRKIIDAYPNATLLRTDRNAMSRRRPRARWHFRDDHRVSAGRRTDRARLSRSHARLCAGRSRSERRPHSRRRLRRSATRRPHGSAQAGRRHRHPLAQILRTPKDGRLRLSASRIRFTSATSL